MRNLRTLVAIFLVLLLTAGCQQDIDHQVEPAKANFEFELPDAYMISDIDDNDCTVYKGTEAIGGIVFTNLNNGKIADIDKTELRQYLDTFAPSPLTYEYVAMYFSDDIDYVSLNFAVTDPTTQEVAYYHHYLFERAGGCYDLWLIDELVGEDEQVALLASLVD